MRSRINVPPGTSSIIQGLVGASSTFPGRVTLATIVLPSPGSSASLSNLSSDGTLRFAINLSLASPHYIQFRLFLFILNGKQMLGNCHLLVVEPRSEKGAEFHECISFCQRCVCPGAALGARASSGTCTGPALGSFAGKFLALSVYVDVVYKLHRESAPRSRFRLHPFPPQQLSPLSVQTHPEHPASSRQQMWMRNTNRAGQECFCVTVFGRITQFLRNRIFFWVCTSNKKNGNKIAHFESISVT